MPERLCLSVETPLGPLAVVEEAGEVVAVDWHGRGTDRTAVLERAADQIRDYFSGTGRGFDLPLRLAGGLTGQVQQAMLAIPFGETRTYGDLARELGASAQAVGQACGGNTIPVIIPCHRILGANGLGGFSAPGGIETKVALLKHEGAAGLLI